MVGNRIPKNYAVVSGTFPSRQHKQKASVEIAGGENVLGQRPFSISVRTVLCLRYIHRKMRTVQSTDAVVEEWGVPRIFSDSRRYEVLGMGEPNNRAMKVKQRFQNLMKASILC